MNVKENDTRRIEYKGRNKGVPARAWRKCGWEGDCKTESRSEPTTAPDSDTATLDSRQHPGTATLNYDRRRRRQHHVENGFRISHSGATISLSINSYHDL
eukprot:Blabericola_migrator_1__3616@NODE_2079_length_3309_cov_28_991055_g1317_i0_p4_GENE_NODE_2079_length_3309_cov_28_991055_g1317_i0NODE_2079_length_3309_cov_28_991055_g1317_i0_p4_ORF_typecomplete_len100_score13_68_NODE_2079_length_3309_cov_28_991055_g1317_i016921991